MKKNSDLYTQSVAHLKAIDDIAAQLGDHIKDLSASIDKMGKDAPTAELAYTLGFVRDAYDRLSDLHKLHKKTLVLQREILIPRRFADEDVTSLGFDDGSRVSLSTKLNASIRSGMKPAAHEWLIENGLSELIQPVVNASTLSAAFKNMMEGENREPPDDIFNCHFVTAASFTRGRKSKKTGGM